MCSFFRRFWLVTLQLTLLVPTAETQAEVLLFEQWRNDLFGLGPDAFPDVGQAVSYQGGQFSNVLDLSSGNLWMRMDDPVQTDGYVVEYIPAPENINATRYELDYEINTLPGSLPVGHNAFQTSLVFGSNSLHISTSVDGMIYVGDNTGFTNTGYAYTPGSATEFSLQADTVHDTYSLDINGRAVLHDQPVNGDLTGRPRVVFTSNYDTTGAQEIGYVELNDNDDGSNLLANGSFEEGLPLGSSDFLDGRGPGTSSATSWTLFHNSSGSTETTRVPAEQVPERLPGSGDSIMRVEASHDRNGLVQVFGALDTGPVIVESSVWVFVESGEVYLGTGNGGNTGADTHSSSTGRWELLKSRNGVWPANELVLYSSGGSSLFYADLARVEVVDVDLIAGDSNLDGLFDSGDLVTVFRAGRYDTGAAANWEQGDWTGDGQFDSSDLIAAFREGNYRASAATAAVPEPKSLAIIIIALPAVMRLRVRRR